MTYVKLEVVVTLADSQSLKYSVRIWTTRLVAVRRY